MIDTRTNRMSAKKRVVRHKMRFFCLAPYSNAFDWVVAQDVLQLSSRECCHFMLPLSGRLERFSSAICIWSSLPSFKRAQLCNCFEEVEDLTDDGASAWGDKCGGGDSIGLVVETTQTFPFLPKTVSLCRRGFFFATWTSTSCSSRFRFLPMVVVLRCFRLDLRLLRDEQWAMSNEQRLEWCNQKISPEWNCDTWQIDRPNPDTWDLFLILYYLCWEDSLV